MNKFSISVVLPSYNEEENIENTLLSCIDYLGERFEDFEIIAVNDGSSDETKSVVEQVMKQHKSVVLVDHPVNLGYGAALHSGFETASKDYIFLMDSDGQFDIKDIDLMLPHVTGENVILGYRKKRADNFIRSLNAFLYNQYIKLFFGLNVKDIDCAFKMFPRSSYDQIKPIRSRGALFSAELLIKLKKISNGFSEVGVNHYPRPHGEQSGANLSVILRMFKESWVFRKELL